MTNFVKVATVDEITPGDRKFVDFAEVTVAIFNVDGRFFAIEDVCTHDGGPLADGNVYGHEIECPRHGALFDLRDGSVVSMPAVVPVPAYQIKVEGRDIYIQSPDD
jgi:3-phenylpropionate/trans-cinnamate dioxygenase ferredoxin component